MEEAWMIQTLNSCKSWNIHFMRTDEYILADGLQPLYFSRVNSCCFLASNITNEKSNVIFLFRSLALSAWKLMSFLFFFLACRNDVCICLVSLLINPDWNTVSSLDLQTQAFKIFFSPENFSIILLFIYFFTSMHFFFFSPSGTSVSAY